MAQWLNGSTAQWDFKIVLPLRPCALMPLRPSLLCAIVPLRLCAFLLHLPEFNE
jgi:hypothetical protein